MLNSLKVCSDQLWNRKHNTFFKFSLIARLEGERSHSNDKLGRVINITVIQFSVSVLKTKLSRQTRNSAKAVWGPPSGHTCFCHCVIYWNKGCPKHSPPPARSMKEGFMRLVIRISYVCVQYLNPF